MAKPNQHGSRSVRAGWTSGNLHYDDVNGNVIFTIDATNRKLNLPSGSKIDGAALTTGIVPLTLNHWRAISSNEIPVKAIASGGGGLLAKDTTPIHERTNGATDKSERIDWATTDVTELTQSFAIPPDWTSGGAIHVKLLGYKSTNTDTTMTLAVGYWEGLGGSNLGGNTAAITQITTVGLFGNVAVTSTSAGAYPGFATVTLIPAAHADDALYMHASWIEYTRAQV